MWILPSRSRPHNLQRLFDAWVRTGASSPVDLCLDADDPCLRQCEAMDMPHGWSFSVGQRGPLSTIYNNAYRRSPNEPWYGFIADDVVPLTDSWDARLVDACGRDGMAVPAGGETTGGCPHFVLGGDLVRSIGWLSLPGLDRIYIDTAWGDIAKARGVLRQVPDVVLEHRHFSNGKAMIDKTYRKLNKESDRMIYERWKSGS